MAVVLVAALGAAIGDNIAYLFGRRIGTTRFRWMRHPRAVAIFDRASSSLERRPAILILTARYIPVGRIAVNMTAGATEFPRRRFMPLTFLAGGLWASYSVGIGLMAGGWASEQPLLAAVLGVVLAIGLGLIADLITRWFAQRRAIPVVEVEKLDEHERA